MNKNFIKLVNTLREKRQEKGLSMNGLAEHIGINHSLISKLENTNSERIDLIMFLKICEVLEINPIELLVETEYLSINNLVYKYFQIEAYDEDDELVGAYCVKALNEKIALSYVKNRLKNINKNMDDDIISQLDFYITELDSNDFERDFMEI